MGNFGDKWFGVKPPDPTGAIPKWNKSESGFNIKNKSGRVIKHFKNRAEAERKKKRMEENNPDNEYTIEEAHNEEK